MSKSISHMSVDTSSKVKLADKISINLQVQTCQGPSPADGCDPQVRARVRGAQHEGVRGAGAADERQHGRRH